MSADASLILQPLFGRSSIQELPSAELENLLTEFPFFNAGHYLLARKLQSEKNAGADLHLQLTSLHFHNPAWLQWLMKYEGEKFDQLAIHLPTEEVHNDFTVGDEKTVAAEEVHSASEIPEASGLIIEQASNQEAKADVEAEITESQIPPAVEAEEIVKPPENPEKEQTIMREQTPVFEPYHTIDYFASLGIKFVPEDNPNDKLGRHLKSFTEWLRTMKRLPQTQPVEQISEEVSEATIKVIADHSVEQREVVTEAMAEVLEKQGKAEEAAEIYRKLSLLNPDKSAYFAAKIQHLKAD